MKTKETIMRVIRRAACVVLLVFAPAASAVPCAGFTDVDTANPSFAPFCANVEWIKNRGVTQGCTATTYCPSEPVSRLAMAAFMNRLGDALTPVLVRLDTSPGAIDLDANAVVCQTTDFAVANFPRTAFVDVTFAGLGPGDVDVAADPVKSTNGGATWTTLTTTANRGFMPTNHWGTMAHVAATDLSVDEDVRFGVRVTRVSGSADLADSRCNLRVAIRSRTGAASPF
jgi:hypothetical protein